MSDNLKQLTIDHHRSAERAEMASILLSGSIRPSIYHDYLYNQLQAYSALESVVQLPPELEGVFRSSAIVEDIEELQSVYSLDPIEEPCIAVEEYVDHINELAQNDDNDGLLAHLYVRHFGDMSGGQIIKDRVPGSGLYYEFDDPDQMKADLRALLHDGMAPEAAICFGFVEQMFDELIGRHEVYFTDQYLMENDPQGTDTDDSLEDPADV